MTTTALPRMPLPADIAGLATRPIAGLHALKTLWAEHRRRARAREDLARLDARILRDLGLDFSAVAALGGIDAVDITRRRMAAGAHVGCPP